MYCDISSELICDWVMSIQWRGVMVLSHHKIYTKLCVMVQPSAGCPGLNQCYHIGENQCGSGLPSHSRHHVMKCNNQTDPLTLSSGCLYRSSFIFRYSNKFQYRPWCSISKLFDARKVLELV